MTPKEIRAFMIIAKEDNEKDKQKQMSKSHHESALQRINKNKMQYQERQGGEG